MRMGEGKTGPQPKTSLLVGHTISCSHNVHQLLAFLLVDQVTLLVWAQATMLKILEQIALTGET
jgi:hypothetical protein